MKIGLLFSLTGTTAVTERGQYEAAKFALSEYSGSKNIEAITCDICSDPEKTAIEAEKLARVGVKIFIGCYTSACRKAIIPILEKYNCLLVYPSLYEGRESHSNILYTGEVPNQQVYVLLDYFHRHYGRKIYCIGTDYIYAHETNEQVASYLKRKGAVVVGEKYVPFGHQQFYDILEDCKAKGADGIFLTLVGQSLISFYKTYHQLNFDPKKLPIFSPTTKETEIEAMGPKYAAGHFSAASYFESLPGESNRSFVKRFQDFTGKRLPISSVMFNTYLGVKIVTDFLEKERYLDINLFFNQISGRNFETPCGMLAIEKCSRHISRPIKVGRALADGQFKVVWDSGQKISTQLFKVLNKNPDVDKSAILEIWSEVSEEAVIVLSKNNTISFMSRKAEELTKFEEGQSLTDSEIRQMLFNSFKIESYQFQDGKYLLLKKRSRQLPEDIVYSFDIVKTKNRQFKAELEVAELASQSSANVLITGETGTGKEVLARAIHRQSERRNKPFIALNMAMLPKELILSELFGYTEGAFTGAKKGGAIGKFEAAHEGTLFLDEIGDMPLELQPVLLRAIETKRIMRIGENRERQVDVRIIAATNRNLSEEIAYGHTFRSDLFYRLNVLNIEIPPLRKRVEDITEISQQTINNLHKKYGSGPEMISNDVLEILTSYHWPGNVRELINVLERAFLVARKENKLINVEHLPLVLQKHKSKLGPSNGLLKKREKELIKQVLEQSETIAQASQILGISRSTLYRKMKEFHISR